jgi:hypothetical protein
MRTAPDVPSLIDDADFLAELDRMESGPATPDAGRAPAPAEDSTQTEPAPMSWPMPEQEEPPAREPLPVRRAAASTPASPEKPLRPQPQRRLRLEPPAMPATPPRPDREAPMRPAHIAEIGERARAPRPTASNATVAQTAPVATPIAPSGRVPTMVASLTVVLGLTVGAGSAALLFHDRVAQIVVTWAK